MQREIKEEHSQQHFTPTAWGMLQWLQGDLACRAHTACNAAVVPPQGMEPLSPGSWLMGALTAVVDSTGRSGAATSHSLEITVPPGLICPRGDAAGWAADGCWAWRGRPRQRLPCSCGCSAGSAWAAAGSESVSMSSAERLAPDSGMLTPTCTGTWALKGAIAASVC